MAYGQRLKVSEGFYKTDTFKTSNDDTWTTPRDFFDKLNKEFNFGLDAEAFNNLGIIYRNLNKYKEAYDCYKHCIKIKPNYSEGYYNLGLLFYKMVNYKKAIDNFSEAIKINSVYIDAYRKIIK